MGLPAGCSLNPNTGAIVGRPVAAAAVGGVATTYTVTIQATTAAGLYARKTFPITVYPAPVMTLTAPAGVVGVAYVGSCAAAAGSSTPYVYTVASGALPNGVSLNAATGALTGTPTLAGVYTGTLLVTSDLGATDSEAFSITIT
jgi:hypothetical protein